MSSNYDKILKLLRNWPLEHAKKGRDYGYYLREMLKSPKVLVDRNVIFPGNSFENRVMVAALERLTKNIYKEQYNCHYKFGATGLHLFDLKEITSDRNSKEVKKKKMAI